MLIFSGLQKLTHMHIIVAFLPQITCALCLYALDVCWKIWLGWASFRNNAFMRLTLRYTLVTFNDFGPDIKNVEVVLGT